MRNCADDKSNTQGLLVLQQTRVGVRVYQQDQQRRSLKSSRPFSLLKLSVHRVQNTGVLMNQDPRKAEESD